MEDKNGFSVVTSTIRTDCEKRVIYNFMIQEFPNKELIIIINKDDFEGKFFYECSKLYSNIKVYRMPENLTLGECLNFGISKASYNLIAKFDDDDFYSKYYLKEAYKAFKNHNCDIVGKGKRYYYLEKFNQLTLRKTGVENNYTKSIAGATLCFTRETFEKNNFRTDIPRGVDTAFLNDAKEKKLKIFATSKYNYMVYRHLDISTHTWQKDAEHFASISEVVKDNVTYEECYPLVTKDI